MAVEMVIGIALVSLLAGVGAGYFLFGAGRVKKARVAELEGALESAQAELAGYKREVFGQFAETAEKFRALDKSYNDLHRQLAESSVALCGDEGTLLLERPEMAALDAVDEEIVVAEADGASHHVDVSLPGDEDEDEDEKEKKEEEQELEVGQGNAAINADADAPTEVSMAPDESEAQVETVSVESDDEVPVLTELDGERSRRESA